MTAGRALRYGVLVSLAASLCSCRTVAPPPAGYFGPTLSLNELVDHVNRNNSAITSLWSRVYFEANLVDPKDKSTHFVNGDGNLQFAVPSSMRLEVTKELVDLFAMGTDGVRYWLWQKNDGIFWWGTYANLGKAGVKNIPIRPDLVMEVLGIRAINPSLLEEPVPVMRFNSDADAYMLDWQARVGDHWAAQKEIWYDRTTLQASKVLLFDAAGRVVLRASLLDYGPIHADGVPQEQWPMIARRFLLFFPESSSHVSLTLRDMTLSHNGFPKAASFHMPNPEELSKAGVKVHAIDDADAP